MGIFGKMREAVFGKPMETSEERIAKAQAEEARQVEAIRRGQERAAEQDAMWQAADKGYGAEMKAEAAARRGEDLESAAVAAQEAQDEAAA